MRRFTIRHVPASGRGAAMPAAMAAVLLSGCTIVGVTGEPSPVVTSGSSGSFADCPDVLVQADPPRHGFGTGDPATSAPDLGVPDAAWVCEYVAEDTGRPDPDGGALYEWRRTGASAVVEDAALEGIGTLLGSLAVPPQDRACTDDLGPRLLLLVTYGDRRVALAIDEFGCREIRLTGDPWATAPGSAGDPTLPAGVLVVDGADPAATVRALSGIGGGR